FSKLMYNTTSQPNDEEIKRIQQTVEQAIEEYSNIKDDKLDKLIKLRQNLKLKTQEFQQHIEQTNNSIQELTEQLAIQQQDTTSTFYPDKIKQHLHDNKLIQNELDQRKVAIEQLQTNIQELYQLTNGDNQTNFIKELDEKLSTLNDQWHQINDHLENRDENLITMLTCSEIFW
ncbi:unnamed protein product, partial [Didymodactylos carnosus]